uniref:Ankyrin repeat domain 13C n=1 Tax=Sphaeramia orbicularis TaxID=375764 RepID=A0A673CHQ9_9TELE
MTGEKVRSLRKDHRPSKDEDLLEPDEEAATGTFTASKTNNKIRASKIFSNHKLIKSSSAQAQQNKQSQINANTNTLSSTDVIDDNNKNPIIRAGQDFPVHECVFKGDVRRLSSLIRTQKYRPEGCPRKHAAAPCCHDGPQRMCPSAAGPQCTSEGEERSGMEPAC